LRRLTDWLDPETLRTLAQQCGFTGRKARKLTPLLFVQATVLLVSQSVVSFRRWATLVGVLGQLCLSKQALWERITPRAVAFLQAVLAHVLHRRLVGAVAAPPAALATFPRVLLQDSTTLKLSPKLASAFPGSRNQCGAAHGQLKIQSLYDLRAQGFVAFRLSGFNRNDQAAAADVLAVACPGDLVLRDLGYFVLASFQQIAQAGAFFLSRLRLDTSLRDVRTGAELDLLGTLQRQGRLDRAVLLGEAQLPVRVVAVKLPAAVAAERRRKAKQNRDQRWRPSARHLALLGWAIFVTNVSREIWSAQTVVQVYGLRWRLETIFKAWKSHFRLTEVPCGAAAQLEALIYARLIFVTVFAQTCAGAAAYSGNEDPPQSLLQWASLIGDFFLVLCLEAWRRPLQESFLRQLNYHGRYERRRRNHFGDTLMNLS
jgi:hypothetical protein